MATKVKVMVRGKGDTLIDYEVSGGDSGSMGSDTKTFRIGEIGSMICFLTLKKLVDCSISLSADNDLNLEIDGKAKSLKKGRNLDVSSKAKRVFVREKPQKRRSV